MSVWDSLVGQKPVIDMLSHIPDRAVPTWPEHSRRRWKARITA